MADGMRDGLLWRTHSLKMAINATQHSPLSSPLILAAAAAAAALLPPLTHPVPPLTHPTRGRSPVPIVVGGVSSAKKAATKKRPPSPNGTAIEGVNNKRGKLAGSITSPAGKVASSVTPRKNGINSPLPPPAAAVAGPPSSLTCSTFSEVSEGTKSTPPTTPSNVITEPVVEVRSVAPTIRGVAKSARILRGSDSVRRHHNSRGASSLSSSSFSSSKTSTPGVSTQGGILAFPTETVYALCCAVPLRRRGSVRRKWKGDNNGAGRTGSNLSTLSGEASGASSTTGGTGCYDGVWDSLLRLKGLNPATSRRNNIEPPSNSTTVSNHILDEPDPPLLYLHSPPQADDILTFTPLKKFIVKASPQKSPTPTSPSNAKGKNDQAKQASTEKKTATLSAVTFSESREVFQRLAARYWPGPVVIYVRQNATVPSPKAGGRLSTGVSRGLSVASSEEGSLSTHAVSQGKMGADGKDAEGRSPPPLQQPMGQVPTPTLPRARAMYNGKSGKTTEYGERSNASRDYYVGLRCPSHPLARRVLRELYATTSRIPGGGGRGANGERTTGKSSAAATAVPTCVVVGFGASVPKVLQQACGGGGIGVDSNATPGKNHGRDGCAVEEMPHPTKARDVCDNLLSIRSEEKAVKKRASADLPGGNDGPKTAAAVATTTVHVLNGEDRREMFSVPTCQYGAPSNVALVIDDITRTVRIVRRGSACCGKVGEFSCNDGQCERSESDGEESADSSSQSQHQHQRPVVVTESDVRRALLCPGVVGGGGGQQRDDCGEAVTSQGGTSGRVVSVVLRRWKVIDEGAP